MARNATKESKSIELDRDGPGHQEVRAQALMRRNRYVDIVILGIVAALSIWVLRGLLLFTR